MTRRATRGGDAPEHVLRTLSEFEPLSYRAYADLAGLSDKAAFERLRHMWDAGMLHVAYYERGRSGKPIPHYAIGRLLDAPKPGRMSNTEKVRRYQATEKGRAAMTRVKQRQRKQHKERLRTDSAYAELHRAKQRQWVRNRHGFEPRALRNRDQQATVAMQLGNTWFFSGWRA